MVLWMLLAQVGLIVLALGSVVGLGLSGYHVVEDYLLLLSGQTMSPVALQWRVAAFFFALLLWVSGRLLQLWQRAFGGPGADLEAEDNGGSKEAN